MPSGNLALARSDRAPREKKARHQAATSLSPFPSLTPQFSRGLRQTANDNHEEDDDDDDDDRHRHFGDKLTAADLHTTLIYSEQV